MKRRMRFGTWCKKDPDDERKIVYTFKMWKDGEKETLHFTSEDTMPWYMGRRLYYAWIEKIELVENDKEEYWNAVLYED